MIMRVLLGLATAAFLAGCVGSNVHHQPMNVGGGGDTSSSTAGRSVTQSHTDSRGDVSLSGGESLESPGGAISGPASPAPESPSQDRGGETADGSGRTEGGNTAPSL